jgi:hypothetical protein
MARERGNWRGGDSTSSSRGVSAIGGARSAAVLAKRAAAARSSGGGGLAFGWRKEKRERAQLGRKEEVGWLIGWARLDQK